MADTSAPVCESTETVTVTVEETPVRAASNEPTLTLRLKKPRTSREVHWAEDTVDNEGMDKKSSKCCCIYTKPKTFDESSSSESDDDCEHCRGHVEKKKKRLKPSDDDDDRACDSNTGHPVPTKS